VGKPFRRELVDSDRYFTHLVAYTRTRRNPVEHGFVDECQNWPYSSYRAVLSAKPTRVQRATVLDWFGGRPGFEEAHALEVEEGVIEALIVKNWM
jgi:putative transposase